MHYRAVLCQWCISFGSCNYVEGAYWFSVVHRKSDDLTYTHCKLSSSTSDCTVSIEFLNLPFCVKVYPYQRNVIQELGVCLDDHKRLVRREAVDARSKW